MKGPARGAHRFRNASFDFSIGRSRKFSTDRSPVLRSTVAVIPGSDPVAGSVNPGAAPPRGSYRPAALGEPDKPSFGRKQPEVASVG